MRNLFVLFFTSLGLISCNTEETSKVGDNSKVFDSLEVFSWCYVIPQTQDTAGYSLCSTYQKVSPSELIKVKNKKACIKEEKIIREIYFDIINKYASIDSNSLYQPNSRFLMLIYKPNKQNDTLVIINSRSIYNAGGKDIYYYSFNVFEKLINFEFYREIKSEYSEP